MNKLKLSILAGCIALISSIANATEIIYPQKQEITINANSTFFVGNEKEQAFLSINDNEVKLSANGGFFYPVDLKFGENIFIINNGVEQLTYKITRNEIIPKSEPTEINYFETPITVAVISNNVPLRSIPVDKGITRLQHFNKGIPLEAVGEYNGFYQIKLSRDDYAWIDKKSVKQITGFNNSPANFQGLIYNEDANKRTYTIKLSKKVPFILSEKTKYSTIDYSYFDKVTTALNLVIYNVKGFPENKLELYLDKPLKGFGYKICYKNTPELVVEVKKPPVKISDKPLSGLSITLDAGHGGEELGATGCLGTKEKDVNLQIVKKLKTELENSGATVFLTRNDDRYLDLQPRVESSRKNNSDIFLSIHNDSLGNGSSNKNPTGSTVYYYYPQATHLARLISKSLENRTGLKNNGINEESFAVVRNTEALSLLIEVAYMICPNDNEKLITEEFQTEVAKAITEAVEIYYSEK